jgi:hypothetical protein
MQTDPTPSLDLVEAEGHGRPPEKLHAPGAKALTEFKGALGWLSLSSPKSHYPV